MVTGPELPGLTPREFRKRIYRFYRDHRRDLPWRDTSDPKWRVDTSRYLSPKKTRIHIFQTFHLEACEVISPSRCIAERICAKRAGSACNSFARCFLGHLCSCKELVRICPRSDGLILGMAIVFDIQNSAHWDWEPDFSEAIHSPLRSCTNPGIFFP